MMLSRNAREFLRGLADGSVQRFGKKARIETVGVVKKLSLAADEQCPALFIQLLITKLVRSLWQEPAVVPGEFDGRHFVARGKVVEGHRSVRIGSAIERCRDRLDRGRHAKIKRPHGDID